MFRERLINVWWKVRWSARATAWMHVLAMYAPMNELRVFFHRLRGVRIGKNVHIVQGCFLEESRPWLISIEDGVMISAGVTIVTHDVVYHHMDASVPFRFGAVTLRNGCILGPRSVILPGVTVGEGALVGAGAIVVKNVPPHTVVAAAPATHLMSLEEGLERARLRIAEYREFDRATKYPWRYAKLRPDARDGSNTK